MVRIKRKGLSDLYVVGRAPLTQQRIVHARRPEAAGPVPLGREHVSSTSQAEVRAYLKRRLSTWA